MKNITVRNITIGEGMPKICVPIVGKTKEELLSEIEALTNIDVDVVEWRMDWFEGVEDIEKTKKLVHDLREALKDRTLLATFRTKKEGGEKEISLPYYVELNKAMIASKEIDLIDVEVFSGDDAVESIVSFAHEHSVYVVMSNHDFDKTPSYDEIIRRLRMMQDKNADIPKIAVMPQSKSDVLTLLQATNDMHEQYADRPIITMSMAGTGVLSRICGEVFGSALTFGAAKKASAPGQVAVKELKTMLELLHNAQ